MLRNFLNGLNDKRIHIVGLSGAEGAAVAIFLIKYGIEENVEASDFVSKREFKKSFLKLHFSLPEKKREEILNSILNSKIKIHYKNDYLKNIEKADVIFASQGWIKHKPNYPRLSKIFENEKYKFWSMTKMYLEFSNAKIIGVTGSNGKSTTAQLIYMMCKNSGKQVFFAGNDRSNIQILDKIEQMKPSDSFVLEISERQLLMPIQKSPHIAVITNIVPNHLDDHKTFRKYIEVKKRILKYQDKRDFTVLNFDNRITRRLAKVTKGKAFFFSRKNKLSKGAFLEGDKIIIKIDKEKEFVNSLNKIKIPGIHNIENILAASLAARLSGVSATAIKKTVEEFKGMPERIEFVAEKGGRKFYYDIQSTTPEATIAALNTFSNKPCLILGGEHKETEYNNLAKKIFQKTKLAVLLPGIGSKKIKNELKRIKFKNLVETNTLKKALNICIKDTKNSDIILLSPACAFFKREFIEKPKVSFYDLVKNIKVNKREP